MKKVFSSLLIASLPLAMFGAAPFKLKLYQDNPDDAGFSFEITSLYDGRLIVDYPNIVVNKGKAGCVIYDDKKSNKVFDDYLRQRGGGNSFAGYFGEMFQNAFRSKEERKNFVRQCGVEENSKLAFEYEDARESLMVCQKDRILEIVVPTNVGTYTFSFR